MKKLKKARLKLLIEFVKYNIAGTVFFWSTYLLFFVFETFLKWPPVQALAVASIIGHIFYFILDKEWVFSSDGSTKKSIGEFIRFAIFMTFNYLLNLFLVWALLTYAGLSPYLGQFVTAGFFVFWSYLGLKYWVFPAQVSNKRSKADAARRRKSSQQKAA